MIVVIILIIIMITMTMMKIRMCTSIWGSTWGAFSNGDKGIVAKHHSHDDRVTLREAIA